MPYQPNSPYNDLTPLPPPAELETQAVLRSCIGARAGLAALKQATALIPNPAILINSIPLLEAQASSEIENIVTTTDELFRYADTREPAANAATREALRYRAALRRGFESLTRRPLSTATAVEVCSLIKNAEMDVRRTPGTALRNDATGEIIYTPPTGETLLREKLANWERFVHDATPLDPVIRMSVAHYQFEAIHPFTDGNGRTGRVLNLLMLVEQRLLDLPVLYLSGYIIRRKADYYRMLLDVTRDGAWEAWNLYMLDAVRETAQWTLNKINAIRALMTHTTEYVRRNLPRIYSRELVEQIFLQPYCRISNLVDADIARRETASAYLKSLAEIGVLEERKFRREKLFVHPRLLRLLLTDADDFEPYA